MAREELRHLHNRWVCDVGTLAAILLDFALQRGRFCAVIELRLHNHVPECPLSKPNFTRDKALVREEGGQ